MLICLLKVSWCFCSMEFFLNVFSEFAEFSDKKIVITAKGLEPQPPLV